jgi:hypothetical protein
MLLSCQKLTLALLATIALKVGSFREYVPFSAFFHLFKCILQVVLCEGVQHRIRFCLDHLNCVKIKGFQSGKQKSRKRTSQASRVGGGRQSCFFWQKILSEKGNVTRCVVSEIGTKFDVVSLTDLSRNRLNPMPEDYLNGTFCKER